jgi:hypothetical protein
MFVIATVRKSTLIYIASLLIVIILAVCIYFFTPFLRPEAKGAFVPGEWNAVIDKMFEARNKNQLNGDIKTLESMYITKERNSQWAFEQEVKKAKYIKNWSEKQGIKFIDIKSKVLIRSAKKVGRGYAFNLVVSTEYFYAYEDDPDPENTNMFRIGTYHSLDLIPGTEEDSWIVSREWYTDPFADSLNLNKLKTDDIENYIVSQPARDLSTIGPRRTAALKYADQFAGAAGDEEYGLKYNPKYRDYNPQGGDCANFASQILFEGGKFKKTSTWNYDKGGATKAWVNAQGFKDFWVNSGRASVVAKGSYSQVYKAAYKLLPGDFVAYEKNGKIVHISVVSGADSKGYTLVNCHNTDRYRVPWDLGWSNSGIRFWLVRVHF